MGSFSFKKAPYYKEITPQFIGQYSQTILPNSTLRGQAEIDIRQIPLDKKISRFQGKLPFPLSTLGLLRAKHPHSAKLIDGTCALVAPRVLLTCAHNLYSYEEKIYYKELDYYPSINGAINKKITIKINPSTVKIHQNFQNYETSEHEHFDFGVIFLQEDMEEICGCLEVAVNYHPRDEAIYLFGYPVQVNNVHNEINLYGGKGKVTKQTESLLFYDLQTKGGQSGAPILVESQGCWKIIGIHTISDPSGVLINTNVAKILNSWINIHQSTLAVDDGSIFSVKVGKIFKDAQPQLQKMVKKYQWQNLTELKFVNCNITSQNLMNLNKISWKIKVFVLDNNKIDRICLDPSKFKILDKLSLNNNKITKINDSINNFNRLTRLQLKNNRLTKIDVKITSKNLKILIQGNKCEFMEKVDASKFQY